MKRTTGLLVITLMVVGCATPPATEPPSLAASGSAPTPLPTTKPSEAALPTEAPSPTEPVATEVPSQAPAARLAVKWNADDPKGIGAVDEIVGVAKAGDTYVLVASLPYVDEGYPQSAAYWSTDGSDWNLIEEFPGNDRLLALTAGGPGFVAAGEGQDGGAVWTSTDGRSWASVSDSSLNGALISQLVATDSGLVAFGYNADSDGLQTWTSPDGVEWLAATNQTGREVAKDLEAVGSYAGRAIAFVSEGNRKPPSIWETTGRADWTRTGELKDVASIGRVAGGARGWLAVDGSRAWTSTDGRTWSKGVPGPDVDSDAIVDDAGYVVVGHVGSLPGETCGDQRPFAGHTWTSADGKTWERMRVTAEFKKSMVTNLLVVDRTLIGYGVRVDQISDEAYPVARWTDTLPDVADAGDASDKASVPITCGG